MKLPNEQKEDGPMIETGEKGRGPARGIPEPTLRRLPLYHQYLRRMQAGGLRHISSTKIGSDLHLLPIQVRKDFHITEAAGKPKVGYDIAGLIATMEAFMGWKETTDGYLVGVGNLGSALLGYQGFREYGLNLTAAFDVDESKVGTEIHGVKVLHVNKLQGMIERTGVKIGVLAVPAKSSQVLADIMVGAGIRAIWNFSPVKISVPPGVIVQHENLASSLVVLSKKLAKAIEAKA